MSKRAIMAVTSTVAVCVDEAFSDIESLQQELEDWYNNLPDNLQIGSKGDALQEAVDALGQTASPEVPEILRNDPIAYSQTVRRRMSRSDRRDVAVQRLQAVAEHARFLITELETFADDCENAVHVWEGVEFPGMYG